MQPRVPYTTAARPLAEPEGLTFAGRPTTSPLPRSESLHPLALRSLNAPKPRRRSMAKEGQPTQPVDLPVRRTSAAGTPWGSPGRQAREPEHPHPLAPSPACGGGGWGKGPIVSPPLTRRATVCRPKGPLTRACPPWRGGAPRATRPPLPQSESRRPSGRTAHTPAGRSPGPSLDIEVLAVVRARAPLAKTLKPLLLCAHAVVKHTKEDLGATDAASRKPVAGCSV